MGNLNARPDIVNVDGYQGDSLALTVNVLDSSGAVYDLTGLEGVMTIRRHVADLEQVVAAEAPAVIADPLTGVAVFNFDGETMQPLRGSYTYDAEFRATDNTSDRRTLVAGMLNVRGDVTQPVEVNPV